MKPEEFDKILQGAAKNAQFPFDEEQWLAAKAMLPQKRKRRIWPFILFGMFLIGLPFLYLFPETNSIETAPTVSEKFGSKQNIPIVSHKETHRNEFHSKSNTNNPISTNEANLAASDINAIAPTRESQKHSFSFINNNLNPGMEAVSIQRTTTVVSPISTILTAAQSEALSATFNLQSEKTNIDEDYKKISLGLITGISTTVQSPNRFSMNFGFSLSRHFRNGLFINVSPLVLYCYGNDANTKLHKSIIYSLEAHDQFSRIDANHLITLQLPIEAGLIKEKWRLQTGLNNELLLFSYGDIVPVKYIDDTWQSTSSGQTGKLHKRHSERWRRGPTLSCYYQVNPKLEFGFQTTYWQNRYFQRGDLSESNSSDEFQFGFNINYLIF
jgi:hypothetical protein